MIDEIFAFLNRKYVQRADDRQREMGLQYTTAETHDLAKEIGRWVAKKMADKDAEIARLRDLVTCLIENDPDDVISDSGHTVLEHWRHDARRAVNYASPFAVLDREKADD